MTAVASQPRMMSNRLTVKGPITDFLETKKRFDEAAKG
jgi:hypothetical protein